MLLIEYSINIPATCYGAYPDYNNVILPVLKLQPDIFLMHDATAKCFLSNFAEATTPFLFFLLFRSRRRWSEHSTCLNLIIAYSV